jgi:hypothetical protein
MRPTPKVINIVKNPVWRAFAKAPMPDGKQRDLSLAALGAFDEIVNGRGIGDHVDTLALASNVCLVLSERGYGPECEPKIKEAQQALLRVRERVSRGLRIGLDGTGAQALRDMLSTQDQQMAEAGQVEVADAVLEVRTRAAQGHVMTVAA